MVLLSKEELALFNMRDLKIFDVVFRHYYGHIKLYVYNILKNEMVAEDITMQVFMELLNPSAPFNTEENIKAWLFRRAGNRCRFWELQEKQKALRKELMEQSKDPDNKDTQLQHHMDVINAVITILNELPEKYEQDARLPDRDPFIYWNFADTLKRILVNGDATPEGNRDVAEWASPFAENRSWRQPLCDGAWLQEQSVIYKNIDLNECCKTFWTMVAAEQAQPTEQSGKPCKGKVLSIVKLSFKIAAVLIFVLTGTYFLVSSEKKINPTSAVLNSTSQQRGHTTASIDSFYHARPYMQMSTDEAVNEPMYHKVSIPAAGYRQIKLPDGSMVWLSSMTTFIYPAEFSGNKRKVKITGEAYFEVDSNAAMPFLAIVNGVHIETTGGCFNVKAHEEEAGKKITVLQGAVRVSAGPYDVFIKENQSALVEQKKHIAIEFNEDTAKVMAWKDKRFLFINDSLPVMARELARRYNLVLTGNITSDALISYEGSRLEPVETMLAKMRQRNRDFHYKIEGRSLIFE